MNSDEPALASKMGVLFTHTIERFRSRDENGSVSMDWSVHLHCKSGRINIVVFNKMNTEKRRLSKLSSNTFDYTNENRRDL